jgi:hypothetical protein
MVTKLLVDFIQPLVVYIIMDDELIGGGRACLTSHKFLISSGATDYTEGDIQNLSIVIHKTSNYISNSNPCTASPALPNLAPIYNV